VVTLSVPRRDPTQASIDTSPPADIVARHG
jgi:hypothetical protein